MGSHFAAIFQVFYFFDSGKSNYAIFVIRTKNIIICDTKSIDMWIWVDEACRFTNFPNNTSSQRYNDIILKI